MNQRGDIARCLSSNRLYIMLFSGEAPSLIDSGGMVDKCNEKVNNKYFKIVERYHKCRNGGEGHGLLTFQGGEQQWQLDRSLFIHPLNRSVT